MIIKTYQIQSNKVAQMMHFKGFLENYIPTINFKESEENGFTFFDLNFNTEDERNKFDNDFRKISGLPYFED